jgi:hypothetical protein
MEMKKKPGIFSVLLIAAVFFLAGCDSNTDDVQLKIVNQSGQATTAILKVALMGSSDKVIWSNICNIGNTGNQIFPVPYDKIDKATKINMIISTSSTTGNSSISRNKFTGEDTHLLEIGMTVTYTLNSEGNIDGGY